MGSLCSVFTVLLFLLSHCLYKPNRHVYLTIPAGSYAYIVPTSDICRLLQYTIFAMVLSDSVLASLARVWWHLLCIVIPFYLNNSAPFRSIYVVHGAGVPVWWATTSLERPQLPPASHLDLVPLPVTFHVTVVASEPGQQPSIPENFQAALHADAQRAYADGHAAQGASETVAPLITVRLLHTG